MASTKQIIQNKVHKEIEKIKDEVYKETKNMSWSQLKKYFEQGIREFYGSSWRKMVIKTT